MIKNSLCIQQKCEEKLFVDLYHFFVLKFSSKIYNLLLQELCFKSFKKVENKSFWLTFKNQTYLPSLFLQILTIISPKKISYFRIVMSRQVKYTSTHKNLNYVYHFMGYSHRASSYWTDFSIRRFLKYLYSSHRMV